MTATDSFRVTTVLPVSPKKLYAAWLSTKEHSAFSGGRATIDPQVGGRFTAGDGYMGGETLELLPGRRIVQSWRTIEFPAEAPDSRLTVLIAPAKQGSQLTLIHEQLPKGQGASYEDGWKEYYFAPMHSYFGERPKAKKTTATKRAKKVRAPAKKRRAPARKVKPRR